MAAMLGASAFVATSAKTGYGVMAPSQDDIKEGWRPKPDTISGGHQWLQETIMHFAKASPQRIPSRNPSAAVAKAAQDGKAWDQLEGMGLKVAARDLGWNKSSWKAKGAPKPAAVVPTDSLARTAAQNTSGGEHPTGSRTVTVSSAVACLGSDDLSTEMGSFSQSAGDEVTARTSTPTPTAWL